MRDRSDIVLSLVVRVECGQELFPSLPQEVWQEPLVVVVDDVAGPGQVFLVTSRVMMAVLVVVRRRRREVVVGGWSVVGVEGWQ